jgi:hypothetical protein
VRRAFGQGLDQQLFSWPVQGRRVNDVGSSETDVGSSDIGAIRIAAKGVHDLGRTLATHGERTSAVDGLAVERQPVADTVQKIPFLGFDESSGFGPTLSSSAPLLLTTSRRSPRITRMSLYCWRSTQRTGRRVHRAGLGVHHAIACAEGNPLLAVLLDGLAAPTVRMRVWVRSRTPGESGGWPIFCSWPHGRYLTRCGCWFRCPVALQVDDRATVAA